MAQWLTVNALPMIMSSISLLPPKKVVLPFAPSVALSFMVLKCTVRRSFILYYYLQAVEATFNCLL